MRSRALIVVGALAAALVCGGWFVEAGFLAGARHGIGMSLRFSHADGGKPLFDEVLTRVSRDYVDSIPIDSEYRKAIDGMIYELHDPHSVFLPADRLRRLTESTTGTYVGLGIQVDIRDGLITVIAPFPGTPAQRGGLQSGDRIVEINGHSTRGWTQEEASAALRGGPGTSVTLKVERPGVDARIPFTLKRGDIHVHSTRHAMLVRPGIGYVQATVFSDSTARELRQAIDSLRGRGMRTLILDLRNDPGGLLTQGVAVTDLFLARGQAVVTMRGRAPGSTRRFSDEVPGPWPDLGLIVLVNGGTASASEIVAGALQDHDRALVVGTPSYGKGSAQTLFRFDDAGLKLTTALWYTPSGRSINRPRALTADESDDATDDSGAPDTTASHKELYRTDAGRAVYGGGGITPDVVVGDSTEAIQDKALERTLGAQLPHFRDALTDYALTLKATHAMSSPDFAITSDMREELWKRMEARHVTMDRQAFDAMAPAVDRWLRVEIIRFQFGTEALARWSLHHDPVVAAAIELAAHADNAHDLVLHPTHQSEVHLSASGGAGDRPTPRP